MERRIRLQIAEALGPINRYYCSEKHGRDIRDADLLLTHYIKHGGAEDFARRFDLGLTCGEDGAMAAQGNN